MILNSVLDSVVTSTSTSVDPGGGEAPASFLIWNSGEMSGNIVLSDESRTALVGGITASAIASKAATLGSDKYYCEMLVAGAIGLRCGLAARGDGWVSGALGDSPGSYGWDGTAGRVYNDSSDLGAFGQWSTSARLSFAYNASTGDLWLAVDGAFAGDPAAGTGADLTIRPNSAFAPALSSSGFVSDGATLIKPADFLYLPAGFIPFPPA